MQGTGGYTAKISNGFIGAFVYGSSPEDALHKLERHTGLDEFYRPYVAEVIRRLNHWQISYAELVAGINTGTIIL
jgi:hypothetical protein